MKFGWMGIAAATVLLSGCGSTFKTSFKNPIPSALTETWSFADVTATIPDELTVTDKNLLAPRTDIVWHGDPRGDRKAQVREILETGVARGASGLQGDRPVSITITLERFHAVTPQAVARAPSAVHNIGFVAQVFDAETGTALTMPQQINADLEANVGEAALTAANEGQTQKVRITAHLAAVTAAWLGIGPDVRRTFTQIGR